MQFYVICAYDNHVSYTKVNLDLIVDLILCLAYLVEMKQESDVNLNPPWLFKYRSYDLWYAHAYTSYMLFIMRLITRLIRLFCYTLAFWDLGSFVIRKIAAYDHLSYINMSCRFLYNKASIVCAIQLSLFN